MLYHVWSATKKRKWLLQGDVEAAIKTYLWDIASEKGIDLFNFWQARYGWKVIPEGGKQAVLRYIRTQKERPEKYER